MRSAPACAAVLAGDRVDHRGDAVLGLADGALGLALEFLGLALGNELVVARDLADAFLEVSDGFVGEALKLVRGAAHGMAPLM